MTLQSKYVMSAMIGRSYLRHMHPLKADCQQTKSQLERKAASLNFHPAFRLPRQHRPAESVNQAFVCTLPMQLK